MAAIKTSNYTHRFSHIFILRYLCFMRVLLTCSLRNANLRQCSDCLRVAGVHLVLSFDHYWSGAVERTKNKEKYVPRAFYI